MTDEQAQLVNQARASLQAARLLQSEGYHGFAASRAYYAMFYLAEALLLGLNLAFSKHGAVHAAFGEHFVKTGKVPDRFHRSLLRAMAVRHAGDYGGPDSVTPAEAEEQVRCAQEFLDAATKLLDANDRYEGTGLR